MRSAEIDAMIEEDFAGRVLAFGSATAKSCAAIAALTKGYRTADCGGRLPDCRDRPYSRCGGGDAEYP